jgi:hypothetical protein
MVGLAMVAMSCSGSDDDGSGNQVQEAGQAQVDLSADEDESSDDTIPLAEEDQPAILKLPDVFTQFQDCLDAEGHGDADLSEVQANFESLDTALQAALAKCNTESGLTEVFEELQEENENLTPTQIETRNVGTVAFRECAIRGGWEWGELTPDENGLLGFGNNPPVPPGDEDIQDLFTLCQEDAAAAIEEAGFTAEDFGS